MNFITLSSSLIVDIDQSDVDFEDALVAVVIGASLKSVISVGSRVLLRRVGFSFVYKHKFVYRGKTYYEILPEHVVCVLMDD